MCFDQRLWLLGPYVVFSVSFISVAMAPWQHRTQHRVRYCDPPWPIFLNGPYSYYDQCTYTYQSICWRSQSIPFEMSLRKSWCIQDTTSLRFPRESSNLFCISVLRRISSVVRFSSVQLNSVQLCSTQQLNLRKSLYSLYPSVRGVANTAFEQKSNYRETEPKKASSSLSIRKIVTHSSFSLEFSSCRLNIDV